MQSVLDVAAMIVGTDGLGRPLSLRGRIIVLAGDTLPEPLDLPVKQAVIDAFEGIESTILSGGTRFGVAGLAAELGTRPAARTIGYLPEGARGDADSRYDDLHFTNNINYSQMEAVQGWHDLRASGIQPGEVRVLGIGGGAIAAFEYQLGLALGAVVGLVEGSGRAVHRLLEDPLWCDHPNLARVQATASSIRSFISS